MWTLPSPGTVKIPVPRWKLWWSWAGPRPGTGRITIKMMGTRTFTHRSQIHRFKLQLWRPPEMKLGTSMDEGKFAVKVILETPCCRHWEVAITFVLVFRSGIIIKQSWCRPREGKILLSGFFHCEIFLPSHRYLQKICWNGCYLPEIGFLVYRLWQAD